MPILIPFVPSVPNYRLATIIEDVEYLFDVRWNARDNVDPETGEALGAWYFDVRESDETPIACGLKIVLGTYIGRHVNHTLFRDGVFVAVDTERTRREATLHDLGTRVQVRRYTIPEIVGGAREAVQ